MADAAPASSAHERYVALSDPVHQYAQAEKAALDAVVAICAETEGWEQISSEKGVVITRKETPGRPLGVLRGVGVIEGFSPIEVFAVSQLPGCRVLWDPMFEGGRAVAMLDSRSVLSYASSKAVWPTSGRDFCLIMGTRTYPNGTIVNASTSVEDPRVPPVKGKVRADMKLTGWHVEPINGGRDTRLVNINDIDLKGNIPGGLIKTVANKMPLCVYSIRKFLAKYGPPPYPLLLGGLLVSTPDFDNDTSRFTLELDADNARGEETHIHVSPKRYPHGYTGTIQPAEGVTARLLPDGVLAINHKGASGKRIVISFVPNAAAPARVQFNGQLVTAEGMQAAAEEAPAGAAGPAPAPALATHRFSAQIDAACARFRQLVNDTDWVVKSTVNDVEISQKPTPVQPLPIVRGVGKIVGFTPEEVAAAADSPSARQAWDAMHERTETKEYLDASTALSYVSTKGQWPTAGRDMCVVARFWRDDDGTVWSCATSVEDPSVPPVAGKVRATLRLNGWRLRPLADGTEATYITDIDLAGSIPGAILSMVATKLPGCVHDVRRYLETFGPPPSFASLQAANRFNVRFDHPTGTFAGTLDVVPDAAPDTVIRLSPRRFPTGAAIAITPAGKVTAETHPLGVKLIFPRDMAGTQAQIRVTPSASGTTVDGVPLGGAAAPAANGGGNGSATARRSAAQEDQEIRRLVQSLTDRIESLERTLDKPPQRADSTLGATFLLVSPIVAFVLANIL